MLPPLKQTILKSAYLLDEITRVLPTKTSLLPAGERMSVPAGDKLVVKDGGRYLEVIFIEDEEVTGPLVYTRDYQPTSKSKELSPLAVAVSDDEMTEYLLGGLFCFLISIAVAAVIFMIPVSLLIYHFLWAVTGTAFAWGSVYAFRQGKKCRRARDSDPGAYIRSKFPDITRSVVLPDHVAEITVARS